MSASRLPELLEQVSLSAPVVDPSAITRQALTAATAHRRRRMVALPIAAAAAGALAFVVVPGITADRGPAKDSVAGQPALIPTLDSSNGLRTLAMESRYVCCSTADMTQDVHPGGTFALHWWAERPAVARVSGGSVELTVSLIGPYPNVDALKNELPIDGLETYSAKPVTVTDLSPDEVVSTVDIPMDAVPGLYFLRTTSQFGTERSSGGRIITITP